MLLLLDDLDQLSGFGAVNTCSWGLLSQVFPPCSQSMLLRQGNCHAWMGADALS
jgi:hypothetical protein